MTQALKVAQMCLQDSGIHMEAKDLLPWITQQQLASANRTEALQRESRRFLFEATQHQINREEVASLHSQDARWMERIQMACQALLGEVERTAVRLVLIEMCGQGALWLQTVLQTTSSWGGIGSAMASIVS